MVITLDPQTEPAAPPAGELRFVAIRADLMPDEVVGARRAAATRSRVLLGVLSLVLALVAGYGFSWWQTHSARADLNVARARGEQLQQQTEQFAPLVSAQAETAAVHDRLSRLMVGDLPWQRLLATVRAAAPDGVTVTQIGGTVAAPGNAVAAAPAAGAPDLAAAGTTAIGTLTLAGTGPDQRHVANYADALAGVKGLAAPFVTSVVASGNTVTFTMTVVITLGAAGGRYSLPASRTAATAAPGANTTGGR